jgi:hypothetical protein
MRTFRIDMSLTDDKVLEVIRATLGNKPGVMTLNEIATGVGCHPYTVFRSIKRLKSAGRLQSEWQGASRPCRYQVLDHGQSATLPT